MRALEFIRDHVTFKLPYDFSYQMKPPNVSNLSSNCQIYYYTVIKIYRNYQVDENSWKLLNFSSCIKSNLKIWYAYYASYNSSKIHLNIAITWLQTVHITLTWLHTLHISWFMSCIYTIIFAIIDKYNKIAQEYFFNWWTDNMNRSGQFFLNPAL